MSDPKGVAEILGETRKLRHAVEKLAETIIATQRAQIVVALAVALGGKSASRIERAIEVLRIELVPHGAHALVTFNDITRGAIRAMAAETA